MTGSDEHLEEVSQWLGENVASYPTPRAVTLSDFEIDWKQMSGRFYVSLDGQRIEDPFRLSLGQNGWVQFHPPMFTSPLGAPASYRAIELTDDTYAAITSALRSIFPRMKPMGMDAATGALISQRTPIGERIVDRGMFNDLQLKLELAAEGFCVATSVARQSIRD